MNYDLIVIGGGPGGYTAAIRASQLGKKVLLVERERMGGTCLNWGCIPTKALLHTADQLHGAAALSDLGLKVDTKKLDIAAIVAKSRKSADQLAAGVDYLMTKNKIEVVQASATLKESKGGKIYLDCTNADGEVSQHSATNLVVATGATAVQLPMLDKANKRVWTARQAMTPKKLPKRLLVLGGGAIGLEFASFYADLGSEVTIVEAEANLLPTADKAVSSAVEQSFKARGIRVLTSTSLTDFDKKGKATLSSKDEDPPYDNLLVAVGIRPNTPDLGLEAVGVKCDARGFIEVNDECRTSCANIYAIGDVVAGPALAHKAAHQGVQVAETICGAPAHKLGAIPACVYTRPQVASIGITEAEARDLHSKDVAVSTFPLQANGLAVATDGTEGFIKTITLPKTGELLGVHMVGHHVSEMIYGISLAMQGELTDLDFAQAIFPHPTASEAVVESLLQGMGRPLNI